MNTLISLVCEYPITTAMAVAAIAIELARRLDY